MSGCQMLCNVSGAIGYRFYSLLRPHLIETSQVFFLKSSASCAPKPYRSTHHLSAQVHVLAN